MESEKQEQETIPWEESPLYIRGEISHLKEKLRRIENRLYPWYKQFPWVGYASGFVVMAFIYYLFYDKGFGTVLFAGAFFGLGANKAVQLHDNDVGMDLENFGFHFTLTLILAPIAWFVAGWFV